MITAVTLNVNGLRDAGKWSSLWSEIPRVDVICLQETYLSPDQEFSFQLHAQSYNFYYSHGTTNSAGVIIVKRNCCINVSK